MSVSTFTPVSDFPSQLSAGIAAAAERDADRVGRCLADLGLKGTQEAPLVLPADFLINLGVALKLHDLEQQGFSFHRAAGLPSAAAVLDAVFRSLVEPFQILPKLVIDVVRCWATHCSWLAPIEFDADILVDEIDSDDGIKGLAAFLLAMSRQIPVTAPTNSCES